MVAYAAQAQPARPTQGAQRPCSRSLQQKTPKDVISPFNELEVKVII